jgi:hypothetical protein
MPGGDREAFATAHVVGNLEVTMGRIVGVGVVLLVASLLVPSSASAQQSRGRPPVQVQQNYPNPFNPTTTIRFVLPDWMFESGKPVVVTARIYNMAMQLVATPMALDHPEGNVAVEKLGYTTPGLKEAFFNGLDRSGRKIASAVYILILEVNGERQAPIKMVVAK